MRDAFPLKSLASCYLSQKQKQCSIVALSSFIAVGLFGGEDAVGTTVKNGVYSRAYTESYLQ